MNLYIADNNDKYYKIIQMEKEYKDGRHFPINEVVESDIKIDLKAKDYKKIGGFFISDYKNIFRWIVRGDTLCEVIIPSDTRIYRVEGNVKVFVSNKIILVNPLKLNDDNVTVLYNNSNLPENEYFRALAACSIKGYIKTATRLIKEKINRQNIDVALTEFIEFCERRNIEFGIDTLHINSVKLVLDMLNKRKIRN